MNTMTVHDAAITLALSEATIRREFHAGKLGGSQDFATREIRIRRTAVEARLAGVSEREYREAAGRGL